MLKKDGQEQFQEHTALGYDPLIENHDAGMSYRADIKLLKKPRADRKPSNGGKWTAEEDKKLFDIVQVHGAKCWKKIANLLGPTRTDVQCLHRYNKVLKPGLQKGSWTEGEDDIVRETVAQYGVGNVKWSAIAERLPGRLGKQCRERWLNHLDPGIKKGDWSSSEDRILYEAQRQFGNRWCEVAKILPGRTENAVKNRWHSSTMRRWLKESNLEPGPGTPLIDITPANAELILSTFSERLRAGGVVIQTDTAAALRSLFHSIHDTDMDDDDDDNIDGSSEGSDGEGNRQSKRSRLFDIKQDNIQDSMDLDVNRDVEGDTWGDYGFPLSRTTAAFSSSSSGSNGSAFLNPIGGGSSKNNKSGLPSHLRPPSIDTTVRDDDPTNLLGGQMDVNSVINMLHTLKSTPSPHSEGKGKRQRRGVSPTTAALLSGQRDGKRQRSTKDKGNSQASRKAVTVETTHDSELDSDAGLSQSPTSRALRRLRAAIAHQQAMQATAQTSSVRESTSNQSNKDDFEQVPLQMLPYFKFLNDNAQRSLMKQLIDRFQRTSCTPRNNVMLFTPKYNPWSASLLSPTNASNAGALDVDVEGLHSILGSPKGILGSVDPDCFDEGFSHDAGDEFDQSRPHGSMHRHNDPLFEFPAAAATTTSIDGKDSMSSREGGISESRRQGMESDSSRVTDAYSNANARIKGKDRKTRNVALHSPSHSSRKAKATTIADGHHAYNDGAGDKHHDPNAVFGGMYSDYDDTAIEAAVMIAFQVASRSTSAEQLLKILSDTSTTPAPTSYSHWGAPLSSTHAASSHNNANNHRPSTPTIQD